LAIRELRESQDRVGEIETGAGFQPRFICWLHVMWLKHEHTKDYSENQDYQENREEQDEQNHGNSFGSSRHVGEAEEAGNQRDHEKDDGPLEHWILLRFSYKSASQSGILKR
jgi:hypothetical protein